MRLITIHAKKGVRLKGALDSKRKSTARHGGTFSLDRRGRWVHVRHQGSVSVKPGPKGIVMARTSTKSSDEEWRILTAFVGFLDRHFHKNIESMSINYR